MLDGEGCGMRCERVKRAEWGRTISWAFYDWANTGYAMIGLALIFPRFYKSFWGAELPPGQQTFYFGLTVSVASLLVALLSPFLGSLAELAGSRKRWLLRFAFVGIVACGLLSLVEAGYWWLASVIHIVGMVSFYSSNIFFDSMLDVVATRKNRNLVSGLGFSFGYTAGFVLIIVIGVVNANPELIGAPDAITANRFLFLFASAWWGLFLMPLAFVFPEKLRDDRPAVRVMLISGLRGAWSTFREILGMPRVRWFLIAYLFYIDGLNTIITSASNLATTMGFEQSEIIAAFAVVQVTAIPCAVGFGLLAQRFGARTMLFVGMAIYIVVTLYGAFLRPRPAFEVAVGSWHFAVSEMMVLAMLIGLVQGGVQALSRSYFANLIPEERSVAFFGFYAMIGKSAAVLGPAIFGLSALMFDRSDDPVWSTRVGFGAISILFVIGAFFLTKVRGGDDSPVESVVR